MAVKIPNSTKNYKFGNTVSSIGVFFPIILNDISFRYEYTNMHSLWYVNSIYAVKGNTKGGFVTGHFASDQRYFEDYFKGEQVVYTDAPPTKSHTLELIYQNSSSSIWFSKLTLIENESNYYNTHGQYSAQYEQAIELQLSNNRQWQEYNIETTLTYGEDVFGDDYAWLSVALFW